MLAVLIPFLATVVAVVTFVVVSVIRAERADGNPLLADAHRAVAHARAKRQTAARFARR
jgi:hypothetical protein